MLAETIKDFGELAAQFDRLQLEEIRELLSDWFWEE